MEGNFEKCCDFHGNPHRSASDPKQTCGSVYGEEPVDKQCWENGKLKSETYYDEE